MLRKPPCAPDCPFRAWDCHTRCEKYAEYSRLQQEDAKKRLENSEIVGYEKNNPRRTAQKREKMRDKKRHRKHW